MRVILLLISLSLLPGFRGGFAPKAVAKAKDTAPPINALLGRWVFTGSTFEGITRPPRSEDFYMEYEFIDNVNSRLMWKNEPRDLFCERRGRYIVRDSHIIEQVIELDRNNTITCGQDPDMRIGTKTTTPFALDGSTLNLKLNLGGKPIIYHWQKKPK